MANNRIACAMYGQPRYLKDGYLCLSKSFSQYDFNVDFFCHSYQYNVNSSYDSSPWSDACKKNVLKDTYNEISNLYNPVKLQVENPYDGDVSEVQNSLIGSETFAYDKLLFGNIKNILSQFYSRSKLCQLIRDHISAYDFIVTCRYDFRQTLGKKILNEINLEKIYTNDSFGYLNDNLLIMNSENFTKITNVYENLPNIINNESLKQKSHEKNQRFIVNAEDLLCINILYYHEDFNVIYGTSEIPNFY